MFWFAGDEKTRQMAIVFTQQTDFTYSVKSLRDFTPLPHVRRNTRGLFGTDLINRFLEYAVVNDRVPP